MTTAESGKVGLETETTGTPKIDMSVKIDQVESCVRHVVVTIPRIEVERYHQRCFEELRPRAELPGFRPGKAPRKLLESRFKDHLEDQVKSSLVMDSLQQVTEGGNFSAISEPDMDYGAIDLPKEGDFTFEFKIEVRPEFETPNWKGLTLNRPTVKIDEAVVDSQLKRTLSRFHGGEATDQPAQLGDSLLVNIVVHHEGRLLSEAPEVTVKLIKRLSFADAIIENFGDLMTGVREGEKVATKVTVSAESLNPAFAGKELDVEFEVLEVTRLEIDALSGSLLESLGFDRQDELREFVKSELGKQLEYYQYQELRKQVTEVLTADANWELPESLVKRQTHRELQRQALELRRSGFDESQIASYLNTARRNANEMTIRSLREHFVLEKIAESLKIEPEASEYDEEINLIAEQSDQSPRRIRARLEKSGQMDALRNQIVERRVIDMITAEAKVTDVEDGKFLASMPDDFALQMMLAPAAAEVPEAQYDEKPEDGARPTATVKPD